MFELTSSLKALRLLNSLIITIFARTQPIEKGPVGSKVLERNVCVSYSEIKAEKEQPDHEVLGNHCKFQWF